MEKPVFTWGKRIRAFRKLKGFTQEQLAATLHVSVSVLGNIERGQRVPHPKLLEDIARTLQVSLEELKGERRENV